jgi:hypothetical protein
MNSVIFLFGSPFIACFGALYTFMREFAGIVERETLHPGQYLEFKSHRHGIVNGEM